MLRWLCAASTLALGTVSDDAAGQANTRSVARKPAIATQAGAVALPAGVVAGPSVEGITQYRFPNGLTVLLFPDEGTPATLVNVTYSVGAAHEGQGESGMAHLLEHLLFRGTPTHPGIGSQFKRRGITFNGSTAQDRTNYYGWFEPNDATLDWLLALEADRMRHANVTRADLDSEMTVVRNEMEIGENKPTRRLTSLLSSLAYEWHPYGRNVIGNRSEVENVPVEKLRAFYDLWYQPDNATVIIAGAFDPAHALRRVSATFGAIPKPTRTLPVRYTREPAQDGEREVTIRRTGTDRLLGLSYHTPAITHPDFAALTVLDSVLGSTPSGRLDQNLVKTGLVTSAQSGIDGSEAPGLISFYSIVPKGRDPAQAEQALLAQVERLADRPITDAEVSAAKQRLANLYGRANDTNVIGVANGLSDMIGAGDWRLWFSKRDAEARVTAADVNRVARTYLVSTNRTLARFVPTDTPVRAEIPQAPSPAVALKDYKGGTAQRAVPMFDRSVANIAAHTTRAQLGPDLRLSMLQKPSRGDYFALSMAFHFGTDATTAPYRDAADMAGSLLMRGTRTLSAEALAQRFDDLGARVSISGGGRLAIVNVRATRDKLVPVLRLAADVVRNPAFDRREFDLKRDQWIAALESSGKEPGEIADEAMRKYFDQYPRDHPESYRTKEERLAAVRTLKLEDVRAFHDKFYGTANGEIAIVGRFDPAVATSALKELFVGWNAPVPYARDDPPFSAPARSVRQRFETPGKANAVITSQAKFRMKAGDPDHAALMVAFSIFGGGSMGSRLGTRIREREGLSYYVGSGTIISPTDDNSLFYMQATSAPENMPLVERAMTEELARFIDKGVTRAELADAKTSMLARLRDARTVDAGLADGQRLAMFLDRDPMWDARMEQAVAALTVDQVNAAVRRHIKPADVSFFLAGDFGGIRRTAKQRDPAVASN